MNRIDASGVAAELARVVPGAGSLARLVELDPAALSDGGRIDALIALQRHQGMLQAQELTLLASLEEHPLECIPGAPNALVDFQETREQVAAALHVVPDTAGNRLYEAQRMVGHFPRTLAELAAGRVRLPQLRALSELTIPLGDNTELAAAVEARVLPRMPEQTCAATKKAIRRAIHTVDPDGAQERHERAWADRRTFTAPEGEGMALFGARLAAPDAARIEATLDAHAHAAPEDDPRSMNQKRADALVSIVTDNGGSSAVPETGTPATTALQRGRAGILIQVTVPIDTLIGTSDAPGELRGYGPITATQTRTLAFGPNSIWRRLLTEPKTGRLIKTDPTTYRPTTELQRHIIARDTHCRFPGCPRPADQAEVHHVLPFAHGGPTEERNLIALCKRHHLTTHRARWHLTYQPHTDTVTWTSPTGHVSRNHGHQYHHPDNDNDIATDIATAA
jgi:hypothetical protein